MNSHTFQSFPQSIVIHTTVLAQSIEQNRCLFLEFSCFLYDPMDVGNLISGFSAFSKSRRKYMCKFLVHVLLKPSLEDVELDFAVM